VGLTVEAVHVLTPQLPHVEHVSFPRSNLVVIGSGLFTMSKFKNGPSGVSSVLLSINSASIFICCNTMLQFDVGVSLKRLC
jgi:hypothetical protein